jgi:hypothetical protein
MICITWIIWLCIFKAMCRISAVKLSEVLNNPNQANMSIDIIHGTGFKKFVLLNQQRHRIFPHLIECLKHVDNLSVILRQLPDDEVIAIPQSDSVSLDFDHFSLEQVKYLHKCLGVHSEAASISDPVLAQRLVDLKKGCSEVCNTSITGTPSLFFPQVIKKVDCFGVWSNIHIDDSRMIGPAPRIPFEMMDDFTYNGRIPITLYNNDGTLLNSQYLGGKARVNVWSKEDVENKREACALGTLEGNYGKFDTAQFFAGLKQASHNVVEKRVLVIGSENPWLESCALAAGANEVVTLEYGEIESQHPQIKTYTPDRFRQAYLNGTLGNFDSILTFSSVEHSGLGRYGDALNPWGDLQTMARAWCVAKSNASLVIGVMNENQFSLTPWGHIEFNAHRVYGTLMYSHLVANWKQIWRAPNGYQVVHVLEKIGG